jgi:hypothetical protein
LKGIEVRTGTSVNMDAPVNRRPPPRRGARPCAPSSSPASLAAEVGGDLQARPCLHWSPYAPRRLSTPLLTPFNSTPTDVASYGQLTSAAELRQRRHRGRVGVLQLHALGDQRGESSRDTGEEGRARGPVRVRRRQPRDGDGGAFSSSRTGPHTTPSAW